MTTQNIVLPPNTADSITDEVNDKEKLVELIKVLAHTNNLPDHVIEDGINIFNDYRRSEDYSVGPGKGHVTHMTAAIYLACKKHNHPITRQQLAESALRKQNAESLLERDIDADGIPDDKPPTDIYHNLVFERVEPDRSMALASESGANTDTDDDDTKGDVLITPAALDAKIIGKSEREIAVSTGEMHLPVEPEAFFNKIVNDYRDKVSDQHEREARKALQALIDNEPNRSNVAIAGGALWAPVVATGSGNPGNGLDNYLKRKTILNETGMTGVTIREVADNALEYNDDIQPVEN